MSDFRDNDPSACTGCGLAWNGEQSRTHDRQTCEAIAALRLENQKLCADVLSLEAERVRYQAALQAIGGAHESVVGLSAIVTAKAALNGSDDE